MKKFFSFAMSSVLLASALVSCAYIPARTADETASASSDARAGEAWLENRLGEIPDGTVVGVGSNEQYGIDMSDFEEDGYILRELGGEVLVFGKSSAGLDLAVRKYAKAVESGETAGLDEVYHEGYRIEKLTVAGTDISEYGIYYPSDNNEGMLFAVSELQKLVKKACGAELSAAQGEPSGKYIEFRFLDDESFNDGGYRYRVENGSIIIEGVRNFGCANAVYRFLQEECGWEGLCYGDSILAESEHVDVADGTVYTGNPRFEYFQPYLGSSFWKYDSSYPNQKQTSYGSHDGRIYIGRPYRACHGIENNKWISPDRYLGSGRQPCYTDEDIYAELYENVYAYVESAVSAGKRIGAELQSVDIAHPDIMGFCQCKNCMKVYKKENNTNAGAVVQFANRLVEDMRPDYDGIKYLIFAYQGTQKPCLTAPDEDIYVTFCTDRCCANHALNSGECYTGAFYENMTNQVLCEWLEGWVALNGNVLVWHYGLDDGFGSNNYADTLYEDLIYFDEIGVRGVFMEFEFMGFSLNRITNQLGYLINWDRDMTKEEYLSEFDRLLEKDYGDGWENIRRCVDFWTEGENRNGCWHCWYFTEQVTEQNFEYAAEHYDEVYALAKEAVTMANSEEQEIRCVKFFALMVYQGANCSYFTAYDSYDTDKLALIEERWSEMYGELIRCGINPDSISGLGVYGLAETCEEEAWTEWVLNRRAYTAEGAVMRPMPEKYA